MRKIFIVTDSERMNRAKRNKAGMKEIDKVLKRLGSKEVPHPGGVRVRIYPNPRPAPVKAPVDDKDAEQPDCS